MMPATVESYRVVVDVVGGEVDRTARVSTRAQHTGGDRRRAGGRGGDRAVTVSGLAAALAIALAGCSGAEARVASAGDAGPGDELDAAVLDDASDGAPGFQPLHVGAMAPSSRAPDVVLGGHPSRIDTGTLEIDGAASDYFVVQGDYAVLFAGAFTVTGPVAITGGRSLIVVARGAIEITANVGLQAIGSIQGPGASVIGAGGAGASFYAIELRVSSGGGGGSYGTLGGDGGARASGAPAGRAGASYGGAITAALVGGSPGGAGGAAGSPSGGGGGGGGALQLSSATSIRVTAAINASGGGGVGGGIGESGGAGGGAGGELVLEAPSITIGGVLAANGGGGGGGGGAGGSGTPPGISGGDGVLGAAAAAGGAGGTPQGSDGGAGAAGGVSARPGSGANSKGGGGGGGAGRVWLRYRQATPPDLTSATITPPAGVDPSMP